MKIRKVLICFLVLGSFIVTGCKSEYTRYVESELAKGTVMDSLIFDMSMGQKKKDFFATCWELNSQKIISQGTGNTTARYILVPDSSDLTMNIDMLFYGIFDDQEIMRGMRMTYQFVSWAPWNTDRNAEALVSFLKGYYQDNYGENPFIKIKVDKVDQDAWVKIDGNRQILMYPINDKGVRVLIEDLNQKI